MLSRVIVFACEVLNSITVEESEARFALSIACLSVTSEIEVASKLSPLVESKTTTQYWVAPSAQLAQLALIPIDD